LKYPIGKFAPQDSYSRQQLDQHIARIASLPSRIEALVKDFALQDYNTRYREDGWTARQVLHHLPDSHMNAYIRFKWALTEDTPLIKAYDEKRWAETPDASLDPRLSLDLLKALHVKWTALLTQLTEADFRREYLHPETKKLNRLDRVLAMYAWHGDHHLGHLKIVAGKSH
ncbi:MAG TPA: putative metal-dependent hydrolase, partial [Chryseosolibacter sp.]